MQLWTDCGLNLPTPDRVGEFRRSLDAAQAEDVKRFVLIASDIAETKRAIEFAQSDSRCVVTAGIHPHQAANAAHNFLAELREVAEHPLVRAIGECGLDYNRNYSPPDAQRRIFAAQVELAVELKLPLYLHERDALEDQLAILEPVRNDLVGAFAHCFTGDTRALERYQALGCYIGVTGWVCDERRGRDLAQAVASIDTQRLLLETDAPYLLPRNIRPRPKTRHNQAGYLPYIAERVAELSGRSLSELQLLTSRNAERLFGAWPEDLE